MSVSAERELLYPLSLFRRRYGTALPAYETLQGEAVPEPYHRLLVHTGDMTSRLENHHGGAIELSVLHREVTPAGYEREVVLRVAETDLPVEYGAIEINLDAFPASLRAQILAERLPLGGLLNSAGFRYRSRPKAFIRIAGDELMSELFGVPPGCLFYGRCNELLDERDQPLAQIVEVLRP